jgi:lysophospholipase L1-like esterase
MPDALNKINATKQGLLIKKSLTVVTAGSLFGLAVFGFEFFFSPYKRLPINGIVKGKRYTWGHLVENNKYGFREREVKTPKPSDVYRVMVLGDSLTWGAGLDVEERYTAIAEKLLNKAFSERKFEVLNFGIPGGATTRERDILEKLKRDVNPDLIAVGFCLNDPQPKREDWSIEREKLSNGIPGRAIDEIARFLLGLGLPYTAKLLNDAFYRSAERLGLIPNWRVALGRTYDPLSKEWQEFVNALRDIKRTSDELNLPPPIFATLNQGRPPQNNSDSNKTFELFSLWFHQAEKVATEIGFVSYNHDFEIADQLRNESLVINKLDGHPSASVNRIYGEKLYRAIAKQFAQQQ